MTVQHGKFTRAAVILLVICFAFNSGYAQEPHKKLYKLLIEMKGWEAEEAEGTSMDMGGMKLITAQRMYSADNSEIQVSIMIGSQAMMGSQTNMQYSDDDQSLSTKTIDGFKVMQTYDKAEKSGAVTVFLESSANVSSLFLLTFNEISPEKALDLAKKFGWKEMKAAVKPLL